MHSETDASLASSWNCRHWATGLGGRQAVHSRPSDRRRRTPDGRACCDDVVVRWDGGGCKIEVADDLQCPMWGGSSSQGTGEPCLGDTGELSLRAYWLKETYQLRSVNLWVRRWKASDTVMCASSSKYTQRITVSIVQCCVRARQCNLTHDKTGRLQCAGFVETRPFISNEAVVQSNQCQFIICQF